MALIFLQAICGMSYGTDLLIDDAPLVEHRCALSFRGLLIASVCEQEIQVMEVALGSVFPILLSSGTLIIPDSQSYSGEDRSYSRRHMAIGRNAPSDAFH